MIEEGNDGPALMSPVELIRMSRLGARAEVMPRLKRQEQHICKTLTEVMPVLSTGFL
jgi:hypothetical protein